MKFGIRSIVTFILVTSSVASVGAEYVTGREVKGAAHLWQATGTILTYMFVTKRDTEPTGGAR